MIKRPTMDFQSLNNFNVIMNSISGNFLPMSGEKKGLGFIRSTYQIFTWIIETIYLSSTAIGLLFYVPAMTAVRDGGVSAIVSVEMLILVPYLSSRHDDLRKLVGKINSILVDSENLRKCIRDSVEPHKKRLQIYTVITISVVTMWGSLSMFELLDQDKHLFTYTDFVIPTYLPGAPFTVNVFFCAVVLQIVGAAYLICKKSSVDVYISYLITLLTAEYRYVHEEITKALDEQGEKTEEFVIASLQRCVQHHCVVIEAGHMLTELMSLNVAVTYINCILRFCFCGFSFVTHPEIHEKALYVMYTIGTMIQVYMLCLCVQELLEASTTVTDDAFHKDWYERGNTVKSIFRTMGLGNRVECRLTAFRIIDLTVPTFGSILNQAYSVCLLLLRV
nr:olfactory receptor 40 [Gregopimpla kuwanae]